MIHNGDMLFFNLADLRIKAATDLDINRLPTFM